MGGWDKQGALGERSGALQRSGADVLHGHVAMRAVLWQSDARSDSMSYVPMRRSH